MEVLLGVLVAPPGEDDGLCATSSYLVGVNDAIVGSTATVESLVVVVVVAVVVVEVVVVVEGNSGHNTRNCDKIAHRGFLKTTV